MNIRSDYACQCIGCGENFTGTFNSIRCHKCREKAFAFELKCCPFCGGQAESYAGSQDYLVRCENCPADIGVFDTEEEAITAWNRRVVVPASPVFGLLRFSDGREVSMRFNTETVDAAVEALRWAATGSPR